MGLDIIGPGFGRTGTSSLKAALEHLGYGPVHHMFEVRDNPALLPAWQAYAETGRIDWTAAFPGYRAQVDWPGAACWRQLAADFPQAKVILTVRDADAWFESAQATIGPFAAARGQHPSAHANAIAAMAHRLVVEGVFDGRLSDRTHATGVFKRHIEEVKATISPERLLIYEVGDGWEPLCAFLDRPVPAITFPHLNSSRQFREKEWT